MQVFKLKASQGVKRNGPLNAQAHYRFKTFNEVELKSSDVKEIT